MSDEVSPPSPEHEHSPAVSQPEAEGYANPLPQGWENEVPRKAERAVAELRGLSSKDRAKVLKKFGQAHAVSQATQISYSQTSIWQGPVPPASELAKFNAVFSGCAERLVAMAEKQQDHRIDLEKNTVRAQMQQSGRGQIFAFFLGVFSIAGGIYLAVTGHDWAGVAIGGGGIGTLAVTFLKGKGQTSRSLDTKAASVAPQRQNATRNQGEQI